MQQHIQTPTFIEDGIVHYCVANMPGAYPITPTFALTNATLPYVRQLARYGSKGVLEINPLMKTALNTYDGILYSKAVGEAHGIESREWTSQEDKCRCANENSIIYENMSKGRPKGTFAFLDSAQSTS